MASPIRVAVTNRIFFRPAIPGRSIVLVELFLDQLGPEPGIELALQLGAAVVDLVDRAREFDEAGRFDRALYKRMGELGMLGLRYEEAYGGADLDWSFTAVLHEELGFCDNAGVAMGISVHTDMATPSLAEFGSESEKSVVGVFGTTPRKGGIRKSSRWHQLRFEPNSHQLLNDFF